MGRIDVQALKVPAEFAAIFEQSKPAAPSAAPPPEATPPTASDSKTATAPGTCSKCHSKVSAVETKMGRCLTCGNNLLPAAVGPVSFKVGI